MELEEIKSAWAQYNTNLQKNLKLNEQILNEIVRGKAQKAINTTIAYEVFSLVTYVVLFFVIIVATVRLAREPVYLIIGTVSILTSAPYVFNSIQRYRLFSRLNFNNVSIIELQKSLAYVNKKFIQSKKVELLLFPVVFLSSAAIFVKFFRHFDIAFVPLNFFVLAGGLLVGYALAIWAYKHYYENKLNNANEYLNELEKFEKE